MGLVQKVGVENEEGKLDTKKVLYQSSFSFMLHVLPGVLGGRMTDTCGIVFRQGSPVIVDTGSPNT